MSEQQLILLLKEADKDVLRSLYTKYRNPFIAFARKFCSNDDDILDAYQDAIILLQEKAIQGSLDDLRCSLKTYVFSIGKHLLYNTLRKQKKKVAQMNVEEEVYDYSTIAFDFLQTNELSERQLQLQRAFATLGKRCKEVLSLFYYRGYTIEEIGERLNYENKNVVKSQKSRCLKQLKDKIQS
jgi:RNA polymerase sigma factor (sigma-70 family)